MRLNPKNVALANELRAIVQARTDQIDDGEAVAAVLLWSFLQDHARAHGIDLEKLAAGQWAAFTEYATENLSLARTN